MSQNFAGLLFAITCLGAAPAVFAQAVAAIGIGIAYTF